MIRRILILLSAIIGIAALVIYFQLQPSAEFQTKSSEQSSASQWLSLAIGVVGLLTALVGLIREILAARRASATK